MAKSMEEISKSIWHRARILKNRAMSASAQAMYDLIEAVGALHPSVRSLQDLSGMVYAMADLIQQLTREMEDRVGEAKAEAVALVKEAETALMRERAETALTREHGSWATHKPQYYMVEFRDLAGAVRHVIKPWRSVETNIDVLTRAKAAIEQDQEWAASGDYALLLWVGGEARWEAVYTHSTWNDNKAGCNAAEFALLAEAIKCYSVGVELETNESLGVARKLQDEGYGWVNDDGTHFRVNNKGCGLYRATIDEKDQEPPKAPHTPSEAWTPEPDKPESKTPADCGFSQGIEGVDERILMVNLITRMTRAKKHLRLGLDVVPSSLILDGDADRATAERLGSKGFGCFTVDGERFQCVDNGVSALEEYDRLNPPSEDLEETEPRLPSKPAPKPETEPETEPETVPEPEPKHRFSAGECGKQEHDFLVRAGLNWRDGVVLDTEYRTKVAERLCAKGYGVRVLKQGGEIFRITDAGYKALGGVNKT